MTTAASTSTPGSPTMPSTSPPRASAATRGRRRGAIWYTTLTKRLNENSDFQAAADATVDVSGELFGAGGAEEQAVRAAWQQVGITPA